METLDQNVLKKYCSYLRNVMYAGKIERLNLTYNTDDTECPHIYLDIIKIRRKYRNQGYGTKVIKNIARFADKYNIQVRLYASVIYGSDLKRLYVFYRRFGFILIKNNKDGHFVRYPEKKVKKTVIKSNKLRIFV